MIPLQSIIACVDLLLYPCPRYEIRPYPYYYDRPRQAPDGNFVGGRGHITQCPDGTFVSGRCLQTPDGKFVGDR